MRGFIKYATYRLIGALTGPLPPRFGYGLARLLSPWLYRFSPGLRHALTQNMRHVLGADADEEQVQTLAHQACTNILRGHYDLFRLSRLSMDEIRQLTHIEGMEHMERALARGKGVIVVTAHFGNVDILAQVPRVYGIPLSAPAQHIWPERLFEYTLRLRRSHGARLFPADGPVTEVFRALRRGEIVGLPCDRGIADSSRLVSFFGSPALLPDGPVRVALRTGAALVPAFGLRLPDNSFLVQIDAPIEIPQTGDREADIAAGVELAVKALERRIAERPEQWLVAAPVWPTDSP